MKKWLFGTPVNEFIPSIGLLVHRLVFAGFLLVGHGWSKLTSFSETAAKFPDPLHIGHQLSMASTIFCEVFCSALVVLGLATRLSVLPVVFMMSVAALLIHADAPFFMGGGAAKEPALLYLAGFAVLFFTGAGRFSLDGLLGKK